MEENKISAYRTETNGLTLKDLVLNKDKCLEEGYYWRQMPIKENRVVDYEVFYSQLLQIAVNAREVLRHVAGSPAVRESGECITGVYSPEGHAATLSSGVLLHVYSMTEVVRFMALNDYENNPGIKDGDFFFNNDPHCGGQHSQDQFIILPVFHEGRLVTWVGGMSHETETGATGPGGYDPKATNRFYEGLLLAPTKIASNDTLHNDFKFTVEHGTRDATIWLMDTQAKMSACIYMRDAVKKLIEKYGIDFYLEAVQEIIEDSRRSSLAKIRDRFLPGTYRAKTYIDALVPDMEPHCLQCNIEMTVDEEGYLIVDLEGSSREGPWPWNGAAPSTRAALFCGTIQTLMYDCKFNSGSYFILRPHIPEGSIYGCSLQSATQKFVGSIGGALAGIAIDCISRMYFACGQLEDVVAPATASLSIPIFGQTLAGKPFMGMPWTSPLVGGSGGRALHDGVHSHYVYFNPEGDCTDCEILERASGVAKFLGRSHRPDSGGFGKYRGGCTIDDVIMLFNIKSGVFNIGGVNYHMPTSQGLMGGYPAPPVILNLAFETNMKEVLASGKPYPTRLGSPEKTEMEQYVSGRLEIHAPSVYPNSPINSYDVIEFANDSAAGFGDPLERDPKLIIEDLIRGTTSMRAAREIYGSIIKRKGPLPQDLECDQQETEKLRTSMRNERKARAIPAKQYITLQRERLLQGNIPQVCALMINDLLQFSPKWGKSFRKEWGLPDDFNQVPIAGKSEKRLTSVKKGE